MKLVSYRGFALNGNGLSAAFERSLQRPSLRPVIVEREGGFPLVSAVRANPWQMPVLQMLIDGDSADVNTLRLGILEAFDTREGPGQLIVSDDNGSNQRYVIAACQELAQISGQAADGFAATLVVSGDQYWRSVTTTTDSETFLDTGLTWQVTNGGDLDAYPIYTFTPEDDRDTNSYWEWRRFVVVRWQSPDGAKSYPVRVSGDTDWNTTGLTPGKAIDETSVGVVVDGVEVDRWFGGANTATGGFDSTTTRLWANLDFQPALTTTLEVAITGGVDEVIASEDISAWPASGLFLIDSELFVYTGRDLYRRAFTGVNKAAYGTSSVTHTAGTTIEWIQHEVFITYTPGTGLAATADDSKRPLIDLLTSTNGSWTWNNTGTDTGFGSALEPERPGQWIPVSAGSAEVFTGNQQGAETDPYDVVGIDNTSIEQADSYARWQVYLPCGVFDFDADGDDHVDGETAYFNFSTNGLTWSTGGESGGSGSGWTAWSETGTALGTQWRYMAFASNGATKSQMDALTITIHNVLRPVVTLGTEQANYEMDLTVTNETTDESITLRTLVGVALNETLTLDTDAKTVITSEYGKNVYGVLTRNTLRKEILRLAPGVNTLRFDEPGMDQMEVTVEFEERTYT
jgi:hypothetical protein